jgi:hypothetical protein
MCVQSIDVVQHQRLVSLVSHYLTASPRDRTTATSLTESASGPSSRASGSTNARVQSADRPSRSIRPFKMRNAASLKLVIRVKSMISASSEASRLERTSRSIRIGSREQHRALLLGQTRPRHKLSGIAKSEVAQGVRGANRHACSPRPMQKMESQILREHLERGNPPDTVPMVIESWRKDGNAALTR